MQISAKYAELQKSQGKEPWARHDVVRAFVGDVGDLLKLTMAEDGVREIENSSTKIAHELSDCLWAIIVIANKYGVDLEESFLNTMDELDRRIDGAKK